MKYFIVVLIIIGLAGPAAALDTIWDINECPECKDCQYECYVDGKAELDDIVEKLRWTNGMSALEIILLQMELESAISNLTVVCY